MKMAKLTSKNQLTLPKAVVEALGSPTHFRTQVHDGVLILWPGRLVSAADAVPPAGDRQDSASRAARKG